jgi:hypothetical protein
LAARLLDDFQVHLLPVLLGSCARLFDEGGAVARLELERLGVEASPKGK